MLPCCFHSKVIMPPSALNRLASLHMDYPMLFELSNGASNRISHCGVLEFTADEGTIYMPYWMMQNLLLQEGDSVSVKNVSLPKGTYVKLQPHTKDLLDISNPKAMLERRLRNYSCLSRGDTIMVEYNKNKYYIDVLETKPGGNAVSIVDTDCEVDFAPPLDYKPPKPINAKDRANNKLHPFSGAARRLDGKPAAAMDNGTSFPSHSQGKIVFGSNVFHKNKETEGLECKQEPSQHQKQSKFQAFLGNKYSLKD
ncbi:hypothetical protein PIB30_003028 [Stylosanthes scabra]|uniref:Ubiquitin fusion degradaton protein n=1 Tax=Stylosanthes scabra TaxID=79078 RepID=A0ABU6W1Q7_9FABA|nr:hypothetical protein [Stylosanthes scabra]